MNTPTTWAELQPRFAALLNEELTAERAADWLRRWSDLEKDVEEIKTRLVWAKDTNPADQAAEAAYLAFMQGVQPEVTRAAHALTTRLLALDWTPGAEHAQLLRRMRNEAELFREENVDLESDIEALANEFNKITGAMRAVVNGESLTIPRAQRLLLDPDRSLREAAFRAIQRSRMEVAPQLDGLFLKLLGMRRRLARNAGFANYRDYAWRALGRFDYTPHDTLRLHDAIAAHVSPVQARVFRERQAALKVDRLRPWDTAADPLGRPALTPFQETRDLVDTSLRVFEALDAQLGGQFRAMRDGGFLDLEPGENKVPGYGYCTFLPRTGQPVIYWSAIGTDGDVRVVMHEAGHAFHFLASGQPQDLYWNLLSPIEFAEVGSQAMELLTLPMLERPVGFYDAQDAARARRDKLETVLRQFTSQAAGDAFQQWLYAEAPEDVSIEEIDRRWLESVERFDVGVDWSGFERERAKGWQFVHVFLVPLYLLEYSLAWLGALQVWRAAQHDAPAALARYKHALSLGNTRPLPELFEAAGARLAFDGETVRELMDFVSEQLPALQATETPG